MKLSKNQSAIHFPCGNVAANPDHRSLRAELELGAVAPAPMLAELLQMIRRLP